MQKNGNSSKPTLTKLGNAEVVQKLLCEGTKDWKQKQVNLKNGPVQAVCRQHVNQRRGGQS